MNSENKNCAEILLGMMKTAWVNFDRRRSYEWKLSFGIWTALAVLIGYAARGDLKLSSEPWEILLFLGGICLFQLFFLHRTHLGNIVDEERAHAYEETLHKIILRDLRDSDIELNLEKVDNARDGVTGISRLGGWCGIIVHLAITFLLVVAVLIVTRKVPKEWPGLLVSIALLAIFVILVRLFHRELKSIPKGVRLSAKYSNLLDEMAKFSEEKAKSAEAGELSQEQMTQALRKQAGMWQNFRDARDGRASD